VSESPPLPLSADPARPLRPPPGYAKPPEPNKGGRPPYEPLTDRELGMLERLAGLGMSHRKLAHILGWSIKTFIKHRENDPRVLQAINRGRAKADAQVASSLFRQALNGDVPAIKWWEQTRGGMREVSVTEHRIVDVRALSDEDLENLIASRQGGDDRRALGDGREEHRVTEDATPPDEAWVEEVAPEDSPDVDFETVDEDEA